MSNEKLVTSDKSFCFQDNEFAGYYYTIILAKTTTSISFTCSSWKSFVTKILASKNNAVPSCKASIDFIDGYFPLSSPAIIAMFSFIGCITQQDFSRI